MKSTGFAYQAPSWAPGAQKPASPFAVPKAQQVQQQFQQQVQQQPQQSVADSKRQASLFDMPGGAPAAPAAPAVPSIAPTPAFSHNAQNYASGSIAPPAQAAKTWNDIPEDFRSRFSANMSRRESDRRTAGTGGRIWSQDEALKNYNQRFAGNPSAQTAQRNTWGAQPGQSPTMIAGQGKSQNAGYKVPESEGGMPAGAMQSAQHPYWSSMAKDMNSGGNVNTWAQNAQKQNPQAGATNLGGQIPMSPIAPSPPQQIGPMQPGSAAAAPGRMAAPSLAGMGKPGGAGPAKPAPTATAAKPFAKPGASDQYIDRLHNAVVYSQLAASKLRSALLH
jgi:hypothetical protein